jgi:MFS family permease
MYAVILLNAVTLTFARPARSAILPQLVPGKMFNNAVTWNATIFETSSMIGPGIGGLILGKGGAASAYIFNAAMLVACAVLTTQFPDVAIRRWKDPEQRDTPTGAAAPDPNIRLEYEPRGDPPETGVFTALWAGVAFVFSSRLLLATMTLDLFAVLLGGAMYLLPVFASDILKVGAVGYGWLRMAPSVGAIGMALILAHRPPMKHAGRAMLLAVAGFGAATLVFGLSRSFWLSMVMLVLTGAFDNISVVVRHTLVQLLTPDAMRGRVSAVNQVFIGSSNELGGMESGLTAAWLGPVGSVLLGGIGTIVTVVAVAAFSPRLRRLGRLDEISADANTRAEAITESPAAPATA